MTEEQDPLGKSKSEKKQGFSAGDQLRPGILLANGWTIVEKCGPDRCGRFSSGYIVQNQDGRRGFLKALIYDAYLFSDDPTEVLKAALDAYRDESRLLGIAKESRLDRVVTLYEGKTLHDETGRSLTSYLIFELADSDGRDQFEISKRADYFDSISIIHDVAVGIYQLHRRDIAHQDIRAPNVLCYKTARAKIADLGKAVDRAVIAQHFDDIVPGDETYAPPELLYNHASPDWAIRRYGADLYLLGSLIVTFFMGTGMTPQLFADMPPALRPNAWDSDQYADVLPYLINSAATVFQRLQSNLITESADPRWSKEVTDIVRQLCHPDPKFRGDLEQLKRGKSQFDLERIVGKLDRLAKRANVFRKRAS